MNKINMRPMPEKIRNCPKKYRPQPMPIFHGCDEITNEMRREAVELFSLLDAESQGWYRDFYPRLFGNLKLENQDNE